MSLTPTLSLKSIRLAGFKSFVDPITIHFPTNLVAILGPNGCGKSNIIDAVKFVLGARTDDLRGTKKEDVIFNGSEKRKPLGRASVELHFNNSNHGLAGEYAGFSEIQIKKEITRDGDTKYFLNGVQCRLKDIDDLVLGTGLGRRGYAIISQGTVSDMISAKPEKLREIFEEAAGISKYKERRRETEHRMRHTEENLTRLNDIRSALGERVAQLAQQAEAAQRYHTLNTTMQSVRIQLLSLRYQNVAQTLAKQAKNHEALSIQHIQVEGALNQKDIEALQLYDVIETSKEQVHQHEQTMYQLGTHIVELEQKIKYGHEKRQRTQEDLVKIADQSLQLREELQQTQQRLATLEQDIEQRGPIIAEHTEQVRELQDIAQNCEEQLKHWQQAWDQFNTEAARIQRDAEVNQARMQHTEQKINELHERQQRLSTERAEIDISPYLEEKITFEQSLDVACQHVLATEQQLETIGHNIQNTKIALEQHQQQYAQYRASLQQLLGKQASLTALQKAALHNHDAKLQQWLSKHGLEKNLKLAELIKVQPAYAKAVEAILHEYLRAVCLTSFDDIENYLQQLPSANVHVFNLAHHAPISATTEISAEFDVSPLIDHVTCESPSLKRLLHDVYICKNLTHAIKVLPVLNAQQSVVTMDGIWLSHAWLHRFNPEDPRAGTLAREHELAEINQEISVLNDEEDIFAQRKKTLIDESQHYEQQREALQQKRNQAVAEKIQLEAKIRMHDQLIDGFNQRVMKLNQDIDDIAHQINNNAQQLNTYQSEWDSALAQIATNQSEHEQLNSKKTAALNALQMTRAQAQDAQQGLHELNLSFQTLQHQKETLSQQTQRIEQQLHVLAQQKISCDELLQQLEYPLTEDTQQLTTQLEQRTQLEHILVTVRAQHASHEQALQALNKEKQKYQAELTQIVQQRQSLELQQENLRVKLETYREQAIECEISIEQLLQIELPHTNESHLDRNLNQLKQDIAALGLVNLAAIDDYQTQLAQKQLLDTQHEDLTTALDTLKLAIARIDEETCERLQATFDQINQGFCNLFTKIFGGGKAELVFTEKNLLTTGVHITAQPPGKRNSSIHLLSGGEKALTAIALIFAIFQLNPAPFCLLDEVDAPLDDANIMRFCNLVKEMSQTLQFIYISHNKITMEMAHQLIGITMQEPGVSRVVAVDMDEAMSMVNAPVA